MLTRQRVARCTRAEIALPAAEFRAFRRPSLLLAAPTCAALTLRKRCARCAPAEIALPGAEQGMRLWAPYGYGSVRFPY
jgi:hypothetical protein